MTANDIINQLYANGSGMTIAYASLYNNILSLIDTSSCSIAIDNNNIYLGSNCIINSTGIYLSSNCIINSTGYFYNGANILYTPPGVNTQISTLWAPCNVASLATLSASMGDKGTANNSNVALSSASIGTIVQTYSTHSGTWTGGPVPVYFDG